MRITRLIGVFVLGCGMSLALGQTLSRDANACIRCHGDADWVGEEAAGIVADFASDIHAEVGLSCQDCHGGNADGSLAESPEESMDRQYAPNPFRGTPEATEIPAFCGHCHSDAARMRRYRPGLRVDQEQEYWTSKHGQALRQGDEKVATCTSCHGAHGILRVGDPRSAVYPTRVAETCHVCHGNAQLMRQYTGPHGRPVDINQYPLWRQSVHAQALLEREDLSAPTCNDCHGNHGAVPPGLDSIGFVCGQCHGREASLFRRSPKAEAWRDHEGYLEEAGAEGCLACHDEDSPQARISHLTSFGECSVCHGNHGVIRPTVAMFAPLPETPCAFCHENSGPLGQEVPELGAVSRHYQETLQELKSTAQEAGIEGQPRLFDWLVDRTLELPFHRQPGEDPESPSRPEFEELFRKFRIGKTSYSFRDPAGGEQIQLEVVRCTYCHEQESAASTGLHTGIHFLERMQELTALTARAERILLNSRRGGVETRDGFLAVEKAVDSQIGLEVLIHTFQEDGPFEEKHQEGMQFVSQALTLGAQAQEELWQRRQGLGVSLIVILAFLIALGLKINRLGA